MTRQELDQYKQRFQSPGIEYLQKAGIIPELFEERHIRCVLPASPMHINHIGIMYAGSIYCLAESVAGFLLLCTYGMEYVIIIKSVEIDFVSPGRTDLIADARIDEKEAEEKMAYIRERGRGQYPVAFDITDTSGTVVAKANVMCYAMKADGAKF